MIYNLKRKIVLFLSPKNLRQDLYESWLFINKQWFLTEIINIVYVSKSFRGQLGLLFR